MARLIASSFGSFAVALTLAGLALGAANVQSKDAPAYLEPLAWLFFIGALIFLAIAILGAVLWVVLWGWRYFHAVDVREGDWSSRYWPLQRIAEVSNVVVAVRRWAGAARISCQMEFPDGEQHYAAHVFLSDGTQSIQFPQKHVDLSSEPKEGDRVTITVSARPEWWRGRASHRTAESLIGITDHRPDRPNTSEVRTAEDAQGTPEPSPEAQ